MNAVYPRNALAAPKQKPWRVTAYRAHSYWGFPISEAFVVGDYRWYWQANAVSFLWHHAFGYACNTWRRSAA